MANPGKAIDGAAKAIEKIAAAVVAAGAAATAMDKVAEKMKIAEHTDRFSIPALYDKESPLNLDQAVELLNNYGLKAIPLKLRLEEAHPKYRNCFDFQIIDSRAYYKKVREGDTIIVKYITQEVIDRSMDIFTEAQNRKAELKRLKAEERAERQAAMKQRVVETAGKTKDSLQAAIAHRLKKGDQN